ncbi:hypothetical protein ES708_25106 [subsurface metagenome]
MFDRKAYMRKWRRDHIEIIRKRNRKWRENNREKIKQYYEKNREKVKERANEWYKNHPKEILKIRKRYNKKKKQYVNDYKLSRGCSICGYNKCAEALVFHHPNNNKGFDIANAITRHRKWEEIKEEMEKCEVLCCRCHRELHAKH